jgi:phosphoribosylaminoimidazolecarboxamide formyltransferase/IMP cyclohydrolase
MLGGRVKTLHPAIHGGILARRTNVDLEELAAHGLSAIDLVAVNLYPFQQTIARPGVSLEEALEQIDIGGVALLRASAKNFRAVAVLSDPDDYPAVVEELQREGAVSLERRQTLALKAFQRTALYDATISRYLAGLFERGRFPDLLPLGMTKKEDLRYGENPHQRAALYVTREGSGPLGGVLLSGKALSYNNILDMDAAWRVVEDFAAPTVVIIKHSNPCGLASAPDLALAFRLALEGDPVSAFGSIVAVNRPFDGATAQAMGDLFVEAVVAPSFTEEAREVLAERKGCRLLEMKAEMEPAGDENPPWEIRSVRGGLLVQEQDVAIGDEAGWKVVTRRAPSRAERNWLAFGWRAVKHVKSNAIVLVQGADGHPYLAGVGAGQMSRVDAVELAIKKAGAERCQGAVLASDAFFPFPDGVLAAAKAGVRAVVQPGGSVRDEEVIAAADETGLAMLFTGMRHFRH